MIIIIRRSDVSGHWQSWSCACVFQCIQQQQPTGPKERNTNRQIKKERKKERKKEWMNETMGGRKEVRGKERGKNGNTNRTGAEAETQQDAADIEQVDRKKEWMKGRKKEMGGAKICSRSSQCCYRSPVSVAARIFCLPMDHSNAPADPVDPSSLSCPC